MPTGINISLFELENFPAPSKVIDENYIESVRIAPSTTKEFNYAEQPQEEWEYVPPPPPPQPPEPPEEEEPPPPIISEDWIIRRTGTITLPKSKPPNIQFGSPVLCQDDDEPDPYFTYGVLSAVFEVTMTFTEQAPWANMDGEYKIVINNREYSPPIDVTLDLGKFHDYGAFKPSWILRGHTCFNAFVLPRLGGNRASVADRIMNIIYQRCIFGCPVCSACIHSGKVSAKLTNTEVIWTVYFMFRIGYAYSLLEDYARRRVALDYVPSVKQILATDQRAQRLILSIVPAGAIITYSILAKREKRTEPPPPSLPLPPDRPLDEGIDIPRQPEARRNRRRLPVPEFGTIDKYIRLQHIKSKPTETVVFSCLDDAPCIIPGQIIMYGDNKYRVEEIRYIDGLWKIYAVRHLIDFEEDIRSVNSVRQMYESHEVGLRRGDRVAAQSESEVYVSNIISIPPEQLISKNDKIIWWRW